MSKFFPFDNLYSVSKSIPELKSKPWVDYMEAPSEHTCRERRSYQLLWADFLFGDLKAGKTTLAKFLNGLTDFLEENNASHFEATVRAYIEKNPKEIERKFLKQLDSVLPMKSSPSLFEILVRSALRMKLTRRSGKVSRPQWLKRFATILAKDMSGTKTEIAGRVKRKLNSISARPIEVSDLVVEKMLRNDKKA